ncbi:MAG: helix-turn-helix domain-containing protein [Planctomycetia bacterium]|nr:helix-turn-helix domain-containing protein [Planctomycetia bacterium]
MVAKTILLTPSKRVQQRFARLRPKTASTQAEMDSLLSHAGKETLWISADGKTMLKLLKSIHWPTKRLGRAVLLHGSTLDTIATLGKCFDPVVFASSGGFLPPDELTEVLVARNRNDLFIGGTVDFASETVTLWRGNLDSLVVPFAAFPPSGDRIAPDFRRFAVSDYGNTVCLGKYEAATDAILYEFDPEYRRRQSKRRLASDRSFGASVRRLRKQRGLRREDFAPLSSKTIARIEQGKVKSVRPKTLSAIAKVLTVAPEEIKTY